MKNALVILNVILLMAVGLLFYLHFNTGKANTKSQNKAEQKDPIGSSAQGGCRIAYFEMDSIAANFVKANEMQKELEKKEDKMNSEMTGLQNKYQERFNNFQQRSANMTPSQLDAARNELAQWSQKINDTKAGFDQEYKTYYVQTQQEILSMIRKFCTEYNKDGKYSIIISNEPGLVFYKDTTMDITKELLDGLNKTYGSGKKSEEKDQ
jgi:outer membrane protein